MITYVLLAVVAMVTVANDTISNRMYMHTALNIWCLKCPPGTHWIAHCTELDHKAKCRPCDPGTFQTADTLAESCEPCRELCKTDREDLVFNCSARTNNVCVCKPGYHRLPSPNNLCIKHSLCPAGTGVIEIGTAVSNTKCQVCEEGYFSPNMSLTQICQPCSTCPEGYTHKGPCPKNADTMCVPEKNEDDQQSIIIGCAVGGSFVILLIVFFVICICSRRGCGPFVSKGNVCKGSGIVVRLIHHPPQLGELKTAETKPRIGTSTGVVSRKQSLKHSSDSDSGSDPEKTPLSNMKRSPSNHNGMTNGDVVNTPQNHVPNEDGMTNGDVVDKPQNHVPNEDLPGTVPDSVLISLSQDLICPEWPFFFRILIGQSAEKHIDESIIDHKGVREQIYKLLRKWKCMEKHKATIEVIVAALRDSDHADLASKYSDRKSTDV